MIPAELVLALRGAAAVAVVTTLAGGVPRLVQAGLAVVLGAWAATVAHPAPLAATELATLALVAGRELAVGAALGVAAAVPLVAARTAGGLVDLAGARRAQGPYAALFGILAAAVFVGIDGHVAVVRGVVDSYAALPPAIAGSRDAAPILDALVAVVPAAVHLAIPWLVTAAIVELAVGAGTRLATRAGPHVGAAGAVATPAALVMITATLVATLAIGIAALVRAALG